MPGVYIGGEEWGERVCLVLLLLLLVLWGEVALVLLVLRGKVTLVLRSVDA